MEKTKATRLIAALGIVAQLAACSAFKSSTQVVSVTADPADAEILINGIMSGRGTASQPVKRNENVQIMVRKAGFETVQRSIGHHLSGTAVLDIVGGVLFLLPLIGLATDGARDLDQTNIAITLPPLASAQPDATQTQGTKNQAP